MLNRLEKIIGIDNINDIKSKKVLIVGIGGVGGYVVEGLVRSGIEHLILVDHDVVDISNKNRQIIALDSTIGLKKVDVMKKRVLDINPNCIVDTYDMFLDNNNKDILDIEVDYIVDACDSMLAKKLIIMNCLDKKIKFISCMGTGNKLDPSRLRISDLKSTSYDPLAKIIRKWIVDEGIVGKIPVLWSDEVPIKTGDRTPGSTSFVPASAGLLIASYVINDIININE